MGEDGSSSGFGGGSPALPPPKNSNSELSREPPFPSRAAGTTDILSAAERQQKTSFIDQGQFVPSSSGPFMELYFEMRASAQMGLSSACEQENEAIAHVGVKGHKLCHGKR